MPDPSAPAEPTDCPPPAAEPALVAALDRIAAALERLAPAPAPWPDLVPGAAYVWRARDQALLAVPRVNRVPLALIVGVEAQKATLLDNTLRFARGLPANNALLWGARGTGKSSLVKAVHAAVTPPVILVEIHRDEIASLPALLSRLAAAAPRRFVLFCDDLTFEAEDEDYKSLKAVLEGGVEGRPETVLFYATSNRRHLITRQMLDNEARAAIHSHEGIDEKVSLSDRFGLWLGFHTVRQDDYLAMVHGYARHYRLPIEAAALERQALAWATGRGARSGRVAWQFIQDLAGALGCTLAPAAGSEASDSR